MFKLIECISVLRLKIQNGPSVFAVLMRLTPFSSENDGSESRSISFCVGGGCGSGVFWLAVAPDRFCEYFLLGINEEIAHWLAELALARFANTFY